MRSHRRRAAIVAVVTAAVWPSTAAADPQGTAGLTLGVAGVGEDGAVWDGTRFHLGARGDVLFGRTANDSFGIGPYAEVMTLGFDDFQGGLGASLLLPVLDTFPMIVSAGGYGRVSEDGFNPGLAYTFFWGNRSYNYHSAYVMSGGVFGQFRHGFADPSEAAIVIGAQLDVAILTLPIAMLINALSGPSAEAAPLD